MGHSRIALSLFVFPLILSFCSPAPVLREAPPAPPDLPRHPTVEPPQEAVSELDSPGPAIPAAPSPTPRPQRFLDADPPPPTPIGGGNGQIAFSSDRAGVSDIFIMGLDGSIASQLTYSADRVSRPVWSPDSSKIAYVLTLSGGFNQEIFVMSADGSSQTQLTDNAAIDSEPSWSPDSKKIAFISNRDSRIEFRGGRFRGVSVFEIYVINADGTGLTRLTDHPSWDTAPTWSPDGIQIAFQSTRDGNTEIYVMNVDGSGLRNLTQNPADDASPSWSPDGGQIAFHSNRTEETNFDIYVMGADGRNQVRLTNHAEWDMHPIWSPNGEMLAFYSERDGNFEIYWMDADGTDQTRLTYNPAFDGFPSWGPLPAAGLVTHLGVMSGACRSSGRVAQPC